MTSGFILSICHCLTTNMLVNVESPNNPHSKLFIDEETFSPYLTSNKKIRITKLANLDRNYL